MPDDYAIDIAVLKEQISGLREQQKAHAQKTDERFSGIDTKLEILINTMNRGKGIFAASLFLAGIIGGAIMNVIHFFMKAPS